jgi:Ca2+-binding EF-hand superfamily protein
MMNNIPEIILVENFGHLAIDRNHDNLITIEDFVISARINGIQEDVAKSAFRSYDKNKNGYLDNTELINANTKLGRLYFESHNVN